MLLERTAYIHVHQFGSTCSQPDASAENSNILMHSTYLKFNRYFPFGFCTGPPTNKAREMLDHNIMQERRNPAHCSGKGGRIPPSQLADSISSGQPQPSAQSYSPSIEKASVTDLEKGKSHEVSTRDSSYDSKRGIGGVISVGDEKGVSSSIEGKPGAAATDVCFLLRNLYMGGDLDVQQQGCKTLPMGLMNTLTLQLGTMRKVEYLSARCWAGFLSRNLGRLPFEYLAECTSMSFCCKVLEDCPSSTLYSEARSCYVFSFDETNRRHQWRRRDMFAWNQAFGDKLNLHDMYFYTCVSHALPRSVQINMPRNDLEHLTSLRTPSFSCEHMRSVTEINLSGNKLREFPDEAGRLTSLR